MIYQKLLLVAWILLKVSNTPWLCIAEEMDWDKNGMVNFKEFLFAFTRWVGIEDMEDEDTA